jgi:hypothetical protein
LFFNSIIDRDLSGRLRIHRPRFGAISLIPRTVSYTDRVGRACKFNDRGRSRQQCTGIEFGLGLGRQCRGSQMDGAEALGVGTRKANARRDVPRSGHCG